MTTTRYPLEPLAAALGIELGRAGRPDDDLLHGWSALADALDGSERSNRPGRRRGPTVQQLRYRGSVGLTEAQADTYATHLRRHPSQIWSTWWSDLDCPCDPDLECSCGFYAGDEADELWLEAA